LDGSGAALGRGFPSDTPIPHRRIIFGNDRSISGL
jgi:hypothetical protein